MPGQNLDHTFWVFLSINSAPSQNARLNTKPATAKFPAELPVKNGITNPARETWPALSNMFAILVN